MSKLLVAAVAVSAIAAFNLAPQPAQARHCSLVKATTQGLTQGVATGGLIGDCGDMPGATLAAGTSLLAPATRARVGGRMVSVHPVKVRQ